MHNPNAMQIVMRLLSNGWWSYDVIQCGKVIRAFPNANDAVAFIEMRS